jgi:hypothetical protein
VSGGEVFVKLDQAQVKEAVDASVRMAVTEALGRNSDALVKAVVDAALNEQTSNGYNRTTAFRAALDRTIRDEAQRAVDALLEAERPRIHAVLRERITAERLVERFIDTILETQGGLFVNVRIAPPSADEDDR